MKTELTSKRWTYQEMLAQLPAESRYELRDAHLIEMPSPKPKHQAIVTNVYDVIKPFIKTNDSGKVFVAPLDVVFRKGDVVQPDLIFVAKENQGVIGEQCIAGAPDLLVEVVSKGSVARDYIEKKNDYEKFGVKEYWIVDSLNETLWIYALDAQQKYVLFSFAEEGATARSQLFPELAIPHSEVFESNDEQ